MQQTVGQVYNADTKACQCPIIQMFNYYYRYYNASDWIPVSLSLSSSFFFFASRLHQTNKMQKKRVVLGEALLNEHFHFTSGLVLGKPSNFQPPSANPLLLSDVLKVYMLHHYHNGISEPKYTPYVQHKSVDKKQEQIISIANAT